MTELPHNEPRICPTCGHPVTSWEMLYQASQTVQVITCAHGHVNTLLLRLRRPPLRHRPRRIPFFR